jgi:ATP-binding cassette subfamily F protein 2
MESIDALAKAVNQFDGGMVLVSHDMRLISQVANEIWICDNKTIEKYQGDILNFKMDMRAQLGLDDAINLKGDASTRTKESAKEERKKKAAPPKAKLEVIAPTSAKPAAVVEVSVTAPMAKLAVTPANNDDDDDTTTLATVSTTVTSAEASTASSPASTPVQGRYVPPHLRRRMQQD